MPKQAENKYIDRIYNTHVQLIHELMAQPVFMEPSSLNAMRQNIDGLLKTVNGTQENSELLNFLVQISEAENREDDLTVEGGVAIIPITRTLTNLPADNFLVKVGAYNSYDQIRMKFNQALEDSDVQAIMYAIDSPGGLHAGMMDLIEELAAKRGQKPTVAMVEEDMYSAAYGIGSTADEIWITRSSGVGSIGTLLVHWEESEWLKSEGITVTDFTYGKKKAQTAPWKPLSDEAKADLQKTVDAAGKEFTEAVAKNLNKSFDEIKNLEAGIFEGQEAINIGLAHKIVPYRMATDEIRSRFLTNSNPESNTKTDEGVNTTMKLEDVKTNLTQFLSGDMKAEAETMLDNLGYTPKSDEEPPDVEKIKSDAKAEGKTEGEQAGKEAAVNRAVEILDLCALAGKPDMAVDLIKSDKSIDQAKKDLTDKQALEAGPDGEIKPTVGAIGDGANNDFLAYMRANYVDNKQMA